METAAIYVSSYVPVHHISHEFVSVSNYAVDFGIAIDPRLKLGSGRVTPPSDIPAPAFLVPLPLLHVSCRKMRLHLTVERHGLPAARVLWTTDGLSPAHSSAGTATIAQLLEQVNDIIPLEYEEWGLEDYTVEVGGFECLHFQEVGQVLKEDDGVWYLRQRASRRLS